MDFTVATQAGPEAAHAGRAWADLGQPLEAEVREPMEQRFGFDFSRVRIHRPAAGNDGPEAARTLGDDIVVRDYAPRTPGGAALIAHELAHVVQQRRGGGAPGVASERAAGSAAEAVLHGTPIGPLGGTAAAVACETPEERARRQAEAFNAEYPQIAYTLDPGRLDREYKAALATARQNGDWTTAAEKLNGFNHIDIQSRLSELSDSEVGYMHHGALGNPRVGPDSNIAKLTAPGTPRASTVPPEPAPEQPKPVPKAAPPKLDQPMTDAQVQALSKTDKLLAAFERAKVLNATVKEIEQLISAKSLCIAIMTFAGIWLVSQVTPAGWAADIAFGITALFVGMVLLDALKHLIAFAGAADAKSEADLQVAGDHFAKAVAEIGVQALIAIVAHSAKGSGGGKVGPPEGGVPYETPAPKGYADMLTDNGFVIRRPVEHVPARAISTATTISPALATELGIKGTVAMMSVSTGPTGGVSASGPGGSGGSGGSKQSEADRLQAKYGDRASVSYPPEEWARIEQLENNFPKLKDAQLRPVRRPRTGAEHAFEERMQTTQGNYSLAGYSKGVKPGATKTTSEQVIQFDGISPQGWIHEIKIEQSATKVDEIVAQLRRQADFAQEYGLRGVEYAVDPPTVADAVEQAVSDQRVSNCFRVR